MNNFWTGTVLALLLGGLGLSAQAAEQGPQQMVMDTTKEVLKILDRERDKIKKDPNHIYGLIDKHVLPHFDFERMSRWTLGRHWRTASEKQKERFIAQFRTLLVRTYASSLLEFSGQKIEFLPFRKGSDEKEAMVRSEVEQAGTFPIPINYRLHKKGDKWLVYDVTIDEISLIANYRTSFANEIRKTNIDKLISQLEKKNLEAKGG